MQARNSFKSGSCEMLILHILKNYGDSYAYEISQIIKKLSDNVISFPEGSLYPAFYKLVKNGYISEYEQPKGKRIIRVYYHIEPAGIERLNSLFQEYCQTIEKINTILEHKFN